MMSLLFKFCWLALCALWLGYGYAGAGNVVAFVVWTGVFVSVWALLVVAHDPKHAARFSRPRDKGPLGYAYTYTMIGVALWAIWQGFATGAALLVWMLLAAVIERIAAEAKAEQERASS